MNDLNLIIYKYNENDEKQVSHLINLCKEEQYLLRILKSEKLVLCYTAHIQNKVVGIIFVWKNDFHPYCTYFRLLTNPFYSNWNIEAKLLAKLGKQNLPLQTSIWETATKLKQFYESNGFKEIRRTYMPVLKLDAIENHLELVDDCSIKTLKEISMNSTLKINLLQFVKKTYEETHLDNPVVEKSLEEWEKLLVEDVIVDGSFIFLDKCEQNIKAYSFLHESDQPSSLELGWCGSVELDFLRPLLLKQLHYTKEHNVEFLQGEFDTTSPYAMFSLGVLPFDPCPTWITYQKLL